MIKQGQHAPPERLSAASRWHRFQRKYAPYIFVSPFFLLFLGFGLFPTIFSMYLSFQKWNPVQGLSSMEFVGLENYVTVLTSPIWWNAFVPQ